MPKLSACRECGKSFELIKLPTLHCSTACRQAFNRRRRDRGAEIYDFLMSGNQGRVAMLVRAYNLADEYLRAGRPSWQPAQTAELRLPAAYGKDGDRR